MATSWGPNFDALSQTDPEIAGVVLGELDRLRAGRQVPGLPPMSPTSAPSDPAMTEAAGRPAEQQENRAVPGVLGRARYLGVALAVTGALAVLGAIIALMWGGPAAGLGFAAGASLVAASYTVSTLAIAWADSVNPRMVLPVGMAMYVTKFSLLGALLIFVGATDWLGKIPMAMGIVAGVVTWIASQIRWTVKTAHPYVRS